MTAHNQDRLPVAVPFEKWANVEYPNVSSFTAWVSVISKDREEGKLLPY